MLGLIIAAVQEKKFPNCLKCLPWLCTSSQTYDVGQRFESRLLTDTFINVDVRKAYKPSRQNSRLLRFPSTLPLPLPGELLQSCGGLFICYAFIMTFINTLSFGLAKKFFSSITPTPCQLLTCLAPNPPRWGQGSLPPWKRSCMVQLLTRNILVVATVGRPMNSIPLDLCPSVGEDSGYKWDQTVRLLGLSSSS
uniref:Uncharacterized protein n=1 Tax=Cannabis sativa TaxID=3483 RepID=A0A803P3L5_CANSA